MTALADRVATPVERADFDDLVTLVTQAPPWEKDRAAGVRVLLRGDRRGQGEGARPDPRPLDVEARARGAQDARPQGEPGVPGGQAPARRGRELPRPPPRGERRSSSSRSRARCPSAVGAALLASAEGYTPRATALLDLAREELGAILEIANALAETCPRPRRRRRSPAAAAEEAGPGGTRPRPRTTARRRTTTAPRARTATQRTPARRRRRPKHPVSRRARPAAAPEGSGRGGRGAVLDGGAAGDGRRGTARVSAGGRRSDRAGTGHRRPRARRHPR